MPTARPAHAALRLILGVAVLWASETPARAKPVPRGPLPRVFDTKPPTPAPAGMTWIPGGVFLMGCDDCALEDAKPAHWVELPGYWLDTTPVTNAAFSDFVRTTGYVTVAQRTPKAEDYPGAPPESLVAGSAVFSPPLKKPALHNPYGWWQYVPGASWKNPQGLPSQLRGRESHPVVHVTYADAAHYCRWAGKRLPTEAEFEFAARGGLHGRRYSWGDQLKPGGRWPANIWQGRFPEQNLGEDGHLGTSPVKAFPPNGFGLYDMAGNVWQWCSDWYRPDYYAGLVGRGSTVRSPQGPADSLDPLEPALPKRVQKGGSFLCSDQYCARFLVAARGKGAVDSSSDNLGFRCAGEVRP